MGQDAKSEAFFEAQIRPILAGTCFRCHGGERVSGGLRVDSRQGLLEGGDSGPAIIPGDPGKSLLLQAILRQADVSAMPPAQDQALSVLQVQAIRDWISAGVYWPAAAGVFESAGHWAFQPIGDPIVPTQDAPWCQNEIDAFVLRTLRSAGLQPKVQADRRTLLRRVTFDLTGLPPTPEELQDFEQDRAPDAFLKVIDRLLAGSAYGEKWGRHWLDVVRYADTAGETADYPVPEAWRYRNYVIDAFNRDLPFDQFVREQIAGDILAQQSDSARFAEQTTATGYLALSRRFGFDSENYHHLTIHDTIDSVGQTFLGLSLGCARCHDHKFDPVSTKEYYALYGIFDSSRYPFPGSEQKQRVRSLAPLVPPGQAAQGWRDHIRQTGDLAHRLTALQRAAPVAVLRSLSEPDGDFELQAPAAGGSNGIPVAPWLYSGPVMVTGEAQSPFQHVYPRGGRGLTVLQGTQDWRVWQALRIREKDRQTLWFGIDLRIRDEVADAVEGHQFQMVAAGSGRAVGFTVKQGLVSLQSGDKSVVLGKYRVGEWMTLQVELNPQTGRIEGKLSVDGEEQVAELQSDVWERLPDGMVFESFGSSGAVRPGLDIDNVAVQPVPFGRPVRDWVVAATTGESAAVISAKLKQLVGIDGDLELQSIDGPLSAPWNAGPGSVVRLRPESQSPLKNLYGAGGQGLYLPQRAAYDGFGLTMSELPIDAAGLLHLAFDFRPYPADTGCGSWRYYIGHGPGPSAAVELHFTDRVFFSRQSDGPVRVADLVPGEWHQLQLVLDTRNRTYKGVLFAPGQRTTFAGNCLESWDGQIDYSFIDSYGHLPGTRPALDIDNFAVRDTALPDISQISADVASELRGEQISVLRRRLLELQGQADQMDQELRGLLAHGPYPMAYAMAEGTPHDVRIQVRGEPDQPGELVARGFVRVVGGEVPEVPLTGSGRLQLADWLVSPRNPLTARVIVNRVWQYHFGTGLVRTPNDFGVRGAVPADPELLDYLAGRFVRDGWSIKSLHRLILSSAAWQQESSSTADDSKGIVCSRRRLSAEEIRDSILAVSGRLDRSMGAAHPFPRPFEWGFSQHVPFGETYDHRLRSVYLMTPRIRRHPFLALFDGADPNASTADRAGTTVPTQALFFMNDQMIHEASVEWAGRLQELAADDSERLRLAWRRAVLREPEAEELREAEEFMHVYASQAAVVDGSRKALEAVLRSLLGSNDFLYVD